MIKIRNPFRSVTLGLAAAVLAACSPTSAERPVRTLVEAPTAAPVGRSAGTLELSSLPAASAATVGGQADLLFVDSSAFDSELTERLGGQPDTTVVRTAGNQVTVNSIPPRLEQWLAAVKATGGKVEPKPVKTRFIGLAAGAIGALVSLFEFSGQATEAIKSNRMYDAAGRYHAQVVYSPADGSIKSVEFVPRSS